MKYLLTGAAGFIGARICELLLEAGYEVVGVDNFNDYYSPRLKRYRWAKLKRHARFVGLERDIESRRQVDSLFKRHSYDAVFNIAARAGVRASIADPAAYFATNVMGTLNVMEAMVRAGVGKLVLASTSSLYAGEPMPFVETKPVNTPISPYAASKKAAETLAYTYHSIHGLDVSILRYFTVYGPGGRPDMMPFRFIEWQLRQQTMHVFGDGSAARDFTHVDDIARGTILAARPLGYEIINLGGGNKPVSIASIIGLLETWSGRSAKISNAAFPATDMQATWADIGRAKALLGWQPQIGSEEGFYSVYNWHLANRSLLEGIRL